MRYRGPVHRLAGNVRVAAVVGILILLAVVVPLSAVSLLAESSDADEAPPALEAQAALTTTEEELKPSVVLIGPNKTQVLPFERRQSVLIMGAGFPPNEILGLHIAFLGAVTDISYLVDPSPATTNELGAFAVNWNTDRIINKKLVGPELVTVAVYDAEGNLLVTAPLAWCDTSVLAEEQDPWCTALSGE